jgi:hypothetical protein
MGPAGMAFGVRNVDVEVDERGVGVFAFAPTTIIGLRIAR